MYVFDTSALSPLFKNFYRSRFPTLWIRFDALVDDGRIESTREVRRELNDSSIESLVEWADAHQSLFATPSAEEGRFVARIYSVANFQHNIERQKILKGGKNADPFVIARAAATGGTVVTMEALRPNGAKIPNICEHFRVRWMALEAFMESEGWTF